LEKVVIASVGPTCSETLVGHGIAIDLEPVHPKMGPLVQETAQRAKELLKKKSGARSQESEVRSPESGVRSQNTEGRSQGSRARSQNTENPESRIPNLES